MKKRIFSTILALIMALSVIYALPMSASAATTPYRTIESDTSYNVGPKETVGGYYFWITDSYNDKTDKSIGYLKCRKGTNGATKILATVKRDPFITLNDKIITNGNTVYYAAINNTGRGYTIYRTTVKGGTPKTIKSVSGELRMGSYYNGRLYYSVLREDADLMSCDVAKKTARVEKKNYVVSSGYGRYMTGHIFISAKTRDMGGVKQYLYNAKTKKTTGVLTAENSVVNGSKIYYIEYDSKRHGEVVKSSNLSGKNVKTIRVVQNAFCTYFGLRQARFMDQKTDAIKKLTYSTGKLTTLK